MSSALRSYGDPCGIARALDLVGERWSLLVVRELVLGSKRFTDLKAGLTGASPNVLSQRLRELEAGGVVRRSSEGAATYELTDWGRELHPLLVQLGLWGARSSAKPKGPLSPDAMMVALESTFQPTRAATLRVSLELQLDEQRYAVRVDRGKMTVVRGAMPAPDVVIDTDVATLRKSVFGHDVEPQGVGMRGDVKRGRAFLKLFARPKPNPDA